MKEPNSQTVVPYRLSEELIQHSSAVGKRALMLLLNFCAAIFPLAGMILLIEYFLSDNPRTWGPVMLIFFIALTLAVTLLWFFRSRLLFNQLSQGMIAVFFLIAIGTVSTRGLEGVGPMLVLFWCILVTSVYGKRSLVYCLPVALILYSVGIIGHWLQLFPLPVLASPSLSGTIYIAFVIGAITTFTVVFVHDVCTESRRIAESDDLLRQELDESNRTLYENLTRIQTLQDQILQCVDCSKFQSLTGFGAWSSIQEYLESDETNKISHGICRTCLEEQFDSDGDSRT